MIWLTLTIAFSSQGLVFPNYADQKAALLDNATFVVKAAKLVNDMYGQFGRKVDTVDKMAEPFTAMIGPSLKLLRRKGHSKEKTTLKQMLSKMDNYFGRVAFDFANIVRRFEELRIQVQLGKIEQKIRVAAHQLGLIHRAPTEAFPQQVQLFIMNYESDFQNSAKKLYHSIIDRKHIFHKNIFEVAVPLTANNRRTTQTFMMNVLKLLLQGVNIDMSYLYMKNYTHSYTFMKNEWERKIKEVTKYMRRIDTAVKEKWKSQAEKDIQQIAQTRQNLNHQEFAHALYNHMKQKFPWRHWLTVVYEPITGADKHWMSACGGFIRFRYFGRNVVVSSVDENKPYLNEADGKNLLENLPSSKYAGDFYHALPDFVKSSCSPYSSTGCLKFGYQGYHVGFGRRSVYVARRDSNVTLHLFG